LSKLLLKNKVANFCSFMLVEEFFNLTYDIMSYLYRFVSWTNLKNIVVCDTSLISIAYW